ncbi:LemA family protein [Patescibacteria group bacterium]|nr:LemA family protein [Patescibacteria group bacterium]
MSFKLFISGIIVFISSIYYTKVFLKSENEIYDIDLLPLLETNEATPDVPFSCHGIIKEIEGNLLKSPYTNTYCVYYHSITEKYIQGGKSSRWETVENIVNFVPFYIVDERGKLKVDISNMDKDFSGYIMRDFTRPIPPPHDSEIDAIPIIKHEEFKVKRTDSIFSIGSNRFRKSEFVLMPNTKIFAHGFVLKENGELVLKEHEKHQLIISNKTKEKYVEEFYKGKSLVFLVHLLTSLGFTTALLSANYHYHFDPAFVYMSLSIGNFLILGSILFTMHNRLNTLKQRALSALSNIDIELKRRSELIPRLVEVIKGYSSHEKNIQNLTAQLRMQTRFQHDLPEKTADVISPLLAISEKYPELNAIDSYQELMRSLIDTEERIAYSRAFYNRSVNKLNTLITQFPFVIVAKTTNTKPMDYLALTSQQQ